MNKVHQAPDAEPNFWSVSTVASVLALSDFTATGLLMWAAGLLLPANPLEELAHISEVFLSTCPLTVAVVLMVVLFRRGRLSLPLAAVIVIGAGLIANAFHVGCDRLLHVGAEWPSRPPGPEAGRGIEWLAHYAWRFLAMYWSGYGALLFGKSCLVGYAIGRWLTPRDENPPPEANARA